MLNKNLHLQSEHLGHRFPCNLCSYAATQKSNLAAHIRAKHGGARGHRDESQRESTRAEQEVEDRDDCEELLPPFKTF
jgi:hypothetical protein